MKSSFVIITKIIYSCCPVNLCGILTFLTQIVSDSGFFFKMKKIPLFKSIAVAFPPGKDNWSTVVLYLIPSQLGVTLEIP